MVNFVLVADTSENGDTILDGGLVDENGLESSLECSILFDILSVLVGGGASDDTKLASC